MDKAEHHVFRHNDVPRSEFCKKLYIYLLNMDTQDGQDNHGGTLLHRKQTCSMTGCLFEVFREH